MRIRGGQAEFIAEVIRGNAGGILIHIHKIVSACESGEQIAARCAGGGDGKDGICSRIDDAVVIGVLVQGHGHIGDSCFRGILHAVAVSVEKDRIADAAGAPWLIAEVHRVQARCQVHDRPVVAGAVIILDLNHDGGELRIGSIDDHDAVAGGKAGESIDAARAGDGGGDQRIRAGINRAVAVTVLV